MAAETFTANKGKGRIVELYNRVKNNEPANSAFVLIPLSAAGSEAEGQDYDDLKALLEDAGFTEQGGGGWERKTLTDSELAAFPEPDDENNRYDVENPEVNFGEPEAGNDVVAFALCYDPNTTEGEDDTLEFLGQSLPASGTIEADGTEVTVKAGEFFRAS